MLAQFIEMAWRHHPEAEAARYRVREAAARRRSEDGFWDPRGSIHTGYAQHDPVLPAIARGFGWSGDALWIEAGIERAFQPGFYAGVGAAHRWEMEETEPDRISAASAQVRVPLVRDRGFSLWQADQAMANSVLRRAHAEMAQLLQDLARDVELRFIDFQLARAQRAVARAAAERAERLLNDAEQMAQLGAIPAYQLHPAKLEVARRHEEETAAERVVITARRRLTEILGAEEWPPDADAPVDLIVWARSTAPNETLFASSAAASRRGDLQAVLADLDIEEARLRRAQEEKRPDISAHAVVGWRNESSNADAKSNNDSAEQWAVGITWRAVIGDRMALGRIEEARARLAARREQLRAMERRVAADEDVFRAEWEAARRRLDLVEEAVETAQAAVSAETERFRLGESTSRQALDAQKDYTDAIRRRYEIAAEVLRADARLRHALGQPPLAFVGADVDDRIP